MNSLFIKRFRQKKRALAEALDRKRRARYHFFMAITALLLFFIMIFSLLPHKLDIKLGQPAPRDIRATRDVVDEITTEKLRFEAIEKVDTVYSTDTSIQIQMKSDMRRYFKLLRELQSDSSKTLEAKLEYLMNSQSHVEADEGIHKLLLTTSQESSLLLEDTVYEIIDQVMGKGILADDVSKSKEDVRSIFNSISGLSEDLKLAGASLINSKISANKFVDAGATDAEKERVADLVEPVVVKEGELIVAQNQNIDRTIYGLIQKSGLVTLGLVGYIKIILGAALLAVIIGAATGLFLNYFEAAVLYNRRNIGLIILIATLVLLICKGLSTISGYLMPIATATILISIIANERVASLLNLVLVVLIGITVQPDMSVLFMLAVSGIIGTFACRNVQQRSNVIFIGAIISMFNIVSIIGFGLVNDFDYPVLGQRLMYGVINGILCAVLSIGTLPVWENIFGVLTPLKLLEIINPNSPLLRRLLIEAPGTYYHSLLVGNLAERAANAIGANALLVRVASYYHDVGKLKRPYFFKENQTDMDNPHDNISPTLSTLIITSHTKDGVELAQENSIPKEISDIMVEHHGTTLVSYFYHKALSEDENVKEEDFRYDGVKPRSKEAGIIMVADSVEAACRTVESPTEEKLKNLIASIIDGKLKDGQLDDSGLTLKDLKLMEKSFLDTISGVYHDRIEYPSLE